MSETHTSSKENNDGDGKPSLPGNESQVERTDGIVDTLKSLNLNSYATRKSIAQGLLDLALLTANASQLKYILSIGESYQFYSLILGLVITSITLQVLQAFIILALGILLDINKVEQQKKADAANNLLVAITVLTVVVNVIISAFDMKDASRISRDDVL